jgi:hypothetical protein
MGHYGADSALREHRLPLAQERTAKAQTNVARTARLAAGPRASTRGVGRTGLMGSYAPPNSAPLAAAGVREV